MTGFTISCLITWANTFERQKWDRAASYFTQSKNVEKLVVCSYLQEEYDELEKLYMLQQETMNCWQTLEACFVV